jgi:hypothetical protein
MIQRVRTLNAEETLNIQAVHLNYPYNFAQPPTDGFVWTLLDLINHSRFPVASLDIADKWNVPFFSLENFLRLIEPSRLSEPGYASPLTVAKLISYCLQILESTAESMLALNGNEAFDGEDLFTQIERLADHSRIDALLCPWNHFWIATRHPTVRWAINNAVMNRWGWKIRPNIR